MTGRTRGLVDEAGTPKTTAGTPGAVGGKSACVPAEPGRTEEEADLIRVVDDRRVIRVPLGPEGVHRADAGLVSRVHVVDDAWRSLRPVLPVTPRATADTGAVDKGPPPHALVIIPHPDRVAQAHAPHRVEGPIDS